MAEPFSDEELMAHADGQLPAARAAVLAQALHGDAELARRLEIQAASKRVLRQAFATLPERPVPEALRALLDVSETSANYIDQLLTAKASAEQARRKTPRRRRWWPVALAASLLLTIGAVNRWLLPQPDVLSLVLDAHATGEPVTTAEGEIVALSTLQLADGRYCREYEQSTRSESRRGLACRMGRQRWEERVLPAAKPGTDGYQLAAGSTDMAEALDARRLNADQEQIAIRRGWPTTP